MSDKLREYAQRILETVTKHEDTIGPGYTHDIDNSGWALAEPYELAAAYLAEHPADDGTEVTGEWLESVGFTYSEQGQYLYCRSLTCWRGCDDGDWQFRFDMACLNRHQSFDTRGDVRRLMAALGISIEESQDG